MFTSLTKKLNEAATENVDLGVSLEEANAYELMDSQVYNAIITEASFFDLDEDNTKLVEEMQLMHEELSTEPDEEDYEDAENSSNDEEDDDEDYDDEDDYDDEEEYYDDEVIEESFYL